MLKKLILLLIFACRLMYADVNGTQPLILTPENSLKIESLKQKIESINNSIMDNLWFKRYGNYMTYQKLIEELTTVDMELKKFKSSKEKNSLEKYEKLLSRQESLEKQLELLYEFKNAPFSKLIEPAEIETYPRISNPFAIISAFSYIKKIKQFSDEYKTRLDRLKLLISKLQESILAQEEIIQIDPMALESKTIHENQKELNAFLSAEEIASTTYSLYVKKVEEATIRVTQDITVQMKRALDIGIIIAFVIIFTLLLKFVAKRYIQDNERFYMANKIINFLNITLIVIILLFSYIENVSYLVTVLGFASAGIAIAMKDWFMSILGWMVIIFGGSLHVGDRVKVKKDGLPYVGDIIDISLLRITIFEDITLTSYLENRRSGRVIFIPNNYIFTTLISNYTHGTLRTVWDGIDIFITFDSNHKKAMYIVREITKKYSKGYTDIARKQLNLLRNQYSLKNTNVEPRIYSFIEPQGMCISAWYMTNSYAALTLRSTLCSEFIEALTKEEDITIAYPTQNINFGKQQRPKELPPELAEKGIV
ncbi:MAG: mechanosensitive ion channel [Sulfurospirillaceae bacterium]|nr:mechanosensitive ion channel [Sulfurospirillaceae bacterium]MDD2825968.1 mechanosensitive ion channel [Sulfurospirillaceae bacterium]